MMKYLFLFLARNPEGIYVCYLSHGKICSVEP
jgi:hypothetical protein